VRRKRENKAIGELGREQSNNLHQEFWLIEKNNWFVCLRLASIQTSFFPLIYNFITLTFLIDGSFIHVCVSFFII
jgi:hypothetical protein